MAAAGAWDSIDAWHASYREAVLADLPVAYFRLADTNGATLRLYVDGVEYGVANTDAAQLVDQTGSIPVIGNFPPAFGDLAAHGTLDEVAIYDKPLAADRIAIHHAIGRNGP